MRRIVGAGSRSNVALRALLGLAFALSATCAAAASGQEAERAAAPPHIPTVPVCELIRHPEQYHGKVVRFSAIQTSGYHGTHMYAVCSGKTRHLSVNFDCGDAAACAQAHEPLRRFWQTHQPRTPLTAGVVAVAAVGRFYGPPSLGPPLPRGEFPPDMVSMTSMDSCGYGHQGASDYAFDVQRYERAWVSPTSQPWAGTREDKIEGKVLGLDSDWQLAVRDGDVKKLDLLLADEYTLTGQDGRVRGKSRLLSDLKNPAEPMHEFIPRCERFRRAGRRGFVTGILTNELSLAEGETESAVGYTNIYESGRGRRGWLLVSTRLTALTQARPTAGGDTKERRGR